MNNGIANNENVRPLSTSWGAGLSRQRLERSSVDLDRHSLKSLRRQGIALCSRQVRERKLAEQQAAAVDAQQRAQALATHADIELGGATYMSCGGIGSGGAPAEQPMIMKLGNQNASSSASSSKRQKTKEVKEVKEPQLSRKPVPLLHRVEVDLRTEGLASWYNATVIQETKTRSKVRLLASDSDAILKIEGRASEEWVSSEFVRPLPPQQLSWVPTVGGVCELSYLDGWWPVKVRRAVADKWLVVYEVYGNTHTVPREQLRPIVIWDGATRSFHTGGN